MKTVIRMALITGGIAVLFNALSNLALAVDSIHQPISAIQTAYHNDKYFETAPYLVEPNEYVAANLQNSQETPASERSGESVVQETEESFGSGTEPVPSTPQPWHLPQPCFLQEHNIAMGGWVQQGITGVSRMPDNRSLGSLATNDRAAEYQLNQAWLFLNRPINNQGDGWDWGGRLDLIYGTDWRFANTLGLENVFNGAYQLYGLALPQSYLDVAYNNLTVRLGHWAPSVGLEIVPAVANFFYSHEYGMAYGQPLLVTGALGIYKLNDQWSINAGANRGWYMFEDNNHAWDGMGGIEWTSPGKWTTVRFNVDSGPQLDPFGNNTRSVYTLTATQKITEQWTYALEHNFGIEENAGPRGSNADWYGLTNYLFYTINPHWSTGIRAEFFRDDDGARVFGIGNQPDIRGWTGGPGFEGTFTELTLG
ncbi:MAG TPA: outer membrane beta-barrel protein, partial [Thermoguttaceae bacterium]